METNRFGRSGLTVSRLTFGCGAVGGLMTKGSPPDQDRAVAWALDHGINFFDTAASYGEGASETHLGRALKGRRDGVVVSTKVGLRVEDLADIEGAVARSLEASLKRLRMDHVDLFQLHNTVGGPDSPGTLDASLVMSQVVPALEKLRRDGKTRLLGFTAKGDVAALHLLVESGAFDSAQIFYNLLVPTAGEAPPAGYPAQDFECLLDKAEACGLGSIGVRVLAGGALSGNTSRHPLGMQTVVPIGSDTDYATDAGRARRFAPLIEAGFAQSLPELALRYAISHPALSTTEIGIATLEELQRSVEAVNKGPLPPQALALVRQIQAGFVDGNV